MVSPGNTLHNLWVSARPLAYRTAARTRDYPASRSDCQLVSLSITGKMVSPGNTLHNLWVSARPLARPLPPLSCISRLSWFLPLFPSATLPLCRFRSSLMPDASPTTLPPKPPNPQQINQRQHQHIKPPILHQFHVVLRYRHFDAVFLIARRIVQDLDLLRGQVKTHTTRPAQQAIRGSGNVQPVDNQQRHENPPPAERHNHPPRSSLFLLKLRSNSILFLHGDFPGSICCGFHRNRDVSGLFRWPTNIELRPQPAHSHHTSGQNPTQSLPRNRSSFSILSFSLSPSLHPSSFILSPPSFVYFASFVVPPP